MQIEFITPSFNEFTLNFPPDPKRTADQFIAAGVLDGCHNAHAAGLIIAKAKVRKERRTRNRLEAFAAGGFPFIQPDPLPLDLENSTRGARRRAQLGRS
jgi:hypothetical protein